MINLQKSEKIPIKDYIIVYLAFAFSSTSFFSVDRIKVALFFIILFIVYLNDINRSRINNNVLVFFLYLFAIFLAQSIYFGEANFSAFVFLLATNIFLPIFVLSITRKNFIDAYINIIFFFSITSIIFWSLSNLSPTFYAFTETIPIKFNTDLNPENLKMFIIYTYEKATVYNIIRNPGPTWEPGGWAVFLTIALMFSLLKSKQFFTIKNIFIIINLITTFSTTAYIATSILILYFIFTSERVNMFIKVIAFPTFLFLFSLIFNNAEFMKEKIENSYLDAQDKNITEVTSGRFFSIRKAVNSISRYPIIGRGLVSATSAKSGEDESSGYGIIDIGVRFGILGLLLYLIILFRSIKILCNSSGLYNQYFVMIFYLVILIHFISQTVYSSIIPLMIFFVGPANILPNIFKVSKIN